MINELIEKYQSQAKKALDRATLPKGEISESQRACNVTAHNILRMVAEDLKKARVQMAEWAGLDPEELEGTAQADAIHPKDEAPRAFQKAIDSGRLNEDPKSRYFAGKYMYMGKTPDGKADAFKHIDTRSEKPRAPSRSSTRWEIA
jgi:uncharacterized glyoxalase superfamily protein PhnB